MAGKDGDGDSDNNDDDGKVRGYGQAANAADTRSVALVVERYHAAVASGSGAAICASLSASLIESLTSASECATTVKGLLQRFGTAEDAKVASVEVTAVRVKRAKGLALLRLPGGEEHYLWVRREGGGWKVDALFDQTMV